MRRLFIIVLFFNVFTVFSQSGSGDIIYLEGLGNGGMFSLNYESTLSMNPVFGLGFRFGVSGIPKTKGFEYHGVGLPLEFIQIFAFKEGSVSHWDIGEGIFLLFNKKVGEDMVHTNGAFTLRTGYRYQKNDKGLFFRASVMFFLNVYNSRVVPANDNGQIFYPWGGLSIGLSL